MRVYGAYLKGSPCMLRPRQWPQRLCRTFLFTDISRSRKSGGAGGRQLSMQNIHRPGGHEKAQPDSNELAPRKLPKRPARTYEVVVGQVTNHYRWSSCFTYPQGKNCMPHSPTPRRTCQGHNRSKHAPEKIHLARCRTCLTTRMGEYASIRLSKSERATTSRSPGGHLSAQASRWLVAPVTLPNSPAGVGQCETADGGCSLASQSIVPNSQRSGQAYASDCAPVTTPYRPVLGA